MPTFRRAHPQADWRACRPDVPSCSAAPGSPPPGWSARASASSRTCCPADLPTAPGAQRRGRRHPRRRAGSGAETGSFISARHAAASRSAGPILSPPGTDEATPLPLVVALHWLGADHRTLTERQAGARPVPRAARDGGGRRSPSSAPDGGRGYWHPHDGEDAGAHGDRRAAAAPPGARLRHQPRVGLWLVDGRVRRTPARPASCGRRPPRSSRAARRCGATPTRRRRPASRTPDEYRDYSVFDSQDRAQPASRCASTSAPGDPFYRDVEEYVEGLPDGRPRHST